MGKTIAALATLMFLAGATAPVPVTGIPREKQRVAGEVSGFGTPWGRWTSRPPSGKLPMAGPGTSWQKAEEMMKS